MSRTVPSGLGAVVAGLVLFVLAACGGPDGAVSATTIDGSRVEVPDPQGRLETPFSEALGLSPLDDQLTVNRQLNQQAEEVVQLCMRRQGYEYIVQPASARTLSSAEPGYLSDEWVATYGFGVSTRWFTQDLAGDDALGFVPVVDFAEQRNAEYLDTLSETQRQDWTLALRGSDDVDGPRQNPQTGSWNGEPGGCYQEAFREVWAASEAMRAQRAVQTISLELRDLYAAYRADSRVLAYYEAVSACVERQGYDWPVGQDPAAYFQVELNELGEEFNGENPSERGPEMQARLLEIQEREIEIAKAVTGCGGGERNEQLVLHDVVVEIQNQFLGVQGQTIEGVLDG